MFLIQIGATITALTTMTSRQIGYEHGFNVIWSFLDTDLSEFSMLDLILRRK